MMAHHIEPVHGCEAGADGRNGLRLDMKRRTTILVLMLLAVTSGCHRAYYRQQATQEAYSLIDEKSGLSPRPLDRIAIDIDARSRMFDPFDPDHEPMPPDDPAAHQLMHCVDCRRGYPHWHDNGDTTAVDSPYWRDYLEFDDQGRLIIDSSNAVRLALLHSTSYQNELEDLFLSALDVSAERFRFDTQFFGGYETNYAALGRESIGAAGSPLSLFDTSTRNIALQKAFTSGADLVVGLANSLVWQFAGPDTHSATTLIDFALVQPLLRRAGRERVMETLTLSERTLLGNVRQMERFRHGFQMDVITGSGEQAGPTRRGGIFGGSGLTGFTGVGGGGFGGVGAIASGQAGGGFVGAQQAGGYLGLLQNKQNIRNLETNITALRSSIAQLEASFEGGVIDSFQLNQAKQDLFERQSELLNAKNAYQNSLDQFKRTLGLPPQIELDIADDLLDQFNLIDTSITPVQNRVADVKAAVGQEILPHLPLLNVSWSDELQRSLTRVHEYLHLIEQNRARIRRENIPRVLADIDSLEELIPQRQEELRNLGIRLNEALTNGETYAEGELDVPVAQAQKLLFDVEGLADLPTVLRDELSTFQQRFQQEQDEALSTADKLQALLANGSTMPAEQLADELRTALVTDSPSVITKMSDSILELSLIQAQARFERINLAPVKMDSATAFEIARTYRLDWMNARASLVDAWRLIEFNANSLESDLDIVFSGDITNTGDNSIRLRGVAGSLRAGIQFDAPLTRLLERNVYRESLIDYQQARRGYYRFEDAVAQSLRVTLRQIELNQINFELRREAVRIAVDQVIYARLQLSKPPEFIEGLTRPQTSPVLTRNLVDALSSLRRAQDAFLSVWVNYEVQRQQLDLDLGTMRLAEDGTWVDPGAIGLEFGYPNQETWELDQLEMLGPLRACEEFQILDPEVTYPEQYLDPETVEPGERIPSLDEPETPSLNGPFSPDATRKNRWGGNLRRISHQNERAKGDSPVALEKRKAATAGESLLRQRLRR